MKTAASVRTRETHFLEEVRGVINQSDLVTRLSAITVAVPRRSEGRTSRHTENWSMCRFLATAADNDLLKFPLDCWKRERQDYYMRIGVTEVGVEITEAIPESYSRYLNIQERYSPSALIDLGLFRYGSAPIPSKMIHSSLGEVRRLSVGWSGDEAEREWAQFMRDSILTKIGKLAIPGYEKFRENWLVIYDNLPRPSINLTKAVKYLRKLINEHLGRSETSFDWVFINSGSVIIGLSRRKTIKMKLINLWP